MVAVAAGTRLGRFVLHEYVGQSTLGSVYRAYDAELGPVTVGLLHRLADPASRARFRDAAPAIAGAGPPNLVRVLAHGEHQGVPSLAAAHVEGDTLAERFRRATVGPAAVLRILAGVAA